MYVLSHTAKTKETESWVNEGSRQAGRYWHMGLGRSRLTCSTNTVGSRPTTAQWSTTTWKTRSSKGNPEYWSLSVLLWPPLLFARRLHSAEGKKQAEEPVQDQSVNNNDRKKQAPHNGKNPALAVSIQTLRAWRQ